MKSFDKNELLAYELARQLPSLPNLNNIQVYSLAHKGLAPEKVKQKKYRNKRNVTDQNHYQSQSFLKVPNSPLGKWRSSQQCQESEICLVMHLPQQPEYPKFDESGNMYKAGTLSSSVSVEESFWH